MCAVCMCVCHVQGSPSSRPIGGAVMSSAVPFIIEIILPVVSAYAVLRVQHTLFSAKPVTKWTVESVTTDIVTDEEYAALFGDK